ncbi:MAG: glycosyltransferase family 4 protein [Erythrobacter sp.]
MRPDAVLAPDRAAASVLLDVTRLVARSWTGRQPTGIDRVCTAYLRHFRSRARAVVQHRGLVRVLSERDSAMLFDLLDTPGRGARGRMARLLSAALVTRSRRPAFAGRAYLNIGHTDFDLAVHREWVRQAGVRPFYFVHDLIPLRHPEFSRPHAVRRHRGRVLQALECGAGIILGSQAVRADLAAFAAEVGLPLPPLAVAPLAGEELSADTGAQPLPAAPFFLCIATIEPRKNHRLLLELWQDFAARMGPATPRLVLAGQTGPMTGALLAPLAQVPGLAAHVEHRPCCTDADLAALIRRARALLMPSLAEGFGLPVVEALQAGTPVIASDLPVFREVAQGAASLVDPSDRAGWRAAILAALHEPAHRVEGFTMPRWPEHFHVVERFIAAPQLRAQAAATPQSERVLAA